MSEERNYLKGAIRHYSSLFSFPSYALLMFYMIVAVVVSTISAFLVKSPTSSSVVEGVTFAFGAFLVPTVCLDLICSRLSSDPVLSLRRLTALSTVTTSAWAFTCLAGAVLNSAAGFFSFERAFFFGAALIMGFRYLVVRSMTSLGVPVFAAIVFLVPGLSLVLGWALRWPSSQLLLTGFGTAFLLCLVGEVFVRVVDRHGEKTVGIGAVELFRAFISDWLAGIADPLEKHLESMSVPADASASLLGFTQNAKVHGLMVVSDIHPGPFRNVGSSNIPWEIQLELEKKTSALVIVPHGTSGHERDLASRRQRERLLRGIVEAGNFNIFQATATSATRRFSGRAQASCQLFGNIALVTLTCAPQSMEDIPFQVGQGIREKGKALGLEEVVVIDAHNSIGKVEDVPTLSREQLRDLAVAAELAIKDALKSSQKSFLFGASRVVPKEFGLREGLGPGGIATAVVEVGDSRMAYVTLDGNNMVQGLRDQARETLKHMVDECEILATDTHAVNAISMSNRGYHPIGEIGSRETLLSYIKECTMEAVSRLRESRFMFQRVDIPRLLVIGEEKLKGLSLLVDSAVALFRRLIVLFYGPSILFAILVFLIQ